MTFSKKQTAAVGVCTAEALRAIWHPAGVQTHGCVWDMVIARMAVNELA